MPGVAAGAGTQPPGPGSSLAPIVPRRRAVGVHPGADGARRCAPGSSRCRRPAAARLGFIFGPTALDGAPWVHLRPDRPRWRALGSSSTPMARGGGPLLHPVPMALGGALVYLRRRLPSVVRPGFLSGTDGPRWWAPEFIPVPMALGGAPRFTFATDCPRRRAAEGLPAAFVAGACPSACPRAGPRPRLVSAPANLRRPRPAMPVSFRARFHDHVPQPSAVPGACRQLPAPAARPPVPDRRKMSLAGGERDDRIR